MTEKDNHDITFEDLRPGVGTGRSYTISGSGKDRVLGYRTGMMCKLGDIEISEWAEMVEKLIAERGEQELYQQLTQHIKDHYPWIRTKAELKQEALELHAYRIFDDPLWVDFIPFNKQYRPGILQNTPLVSILPDCCKKPGYITKARYQERASSCHENYCPHCGRWTTITAIANHKEVYNAI